MLFCVLIISFKQWSRKNVFIVKAVQNHLKREKNFKNSLYPSGTPRIRSRKKIFARIRIRKKSDPKHCYLPIWPNYIRLDGS